MRNNRDGDSSTDVVVVKEAKTPWVPSETVLLQVAIAVRVILIAYGTWQDSSVDVSYTDIDYMVYTDAARSICDGGSPYARSTYRYTPLLAWLLVPNCVFPEYGKFLFSVYDIIAAMYVEHYIHRVPDARKKPYI